MRAFSISLNRTKLYLAGVGERGVLSVIVNWLAGDHGADLFMHVGRLVSVFGGSTPPAGAIIRK